MYRPMPEESARWYGSLKVRCPKCGTARLFPCLVDRWLDSAKRDYPHVAGTCVLETPFGGWVCSERLAAWRGLSKFERAVALSV